MSDSTWLVKIEVDTKEDADHLANHLDLYFSTDWLHLQLNKELANMGSTEWRKLHDDGIPKAPDKPTIELEQLEC